MSHPVLIIGQSGTGKSTSIENLDYKETFIIKATDKPLPFRGSAKKYKQITDWENQNGNMYVLNHEDPSKRYAQLKKAINEIDQKQKNIKTIIIDDFQYLMLDEYMSKCQEKGYEKYAVMAANCWKIFDAICTCRSDLNIIVLCHNDVQDSGLSTIQTMGKFTRQSVKPEGKFTLMLHTYIDDGKYKFLTQFRTIDGITMQAKSPKGMFEDELIDNDLGFVVKRMNEYYHEEFDDVPQ